MQTVRKGRDRRRLEFLDSERFGKAWTDVGLVFTTRSGLPVEPRNLNRSFERTCDGNGIRRVKLHALRHTVASLLRPSASRRKTPR